MPWGLIKCLDLEIRHFFKVRGITTITINNDKTLRCTIYSEFRDCKPVNNNQYSSSVWRGGGRGGGRGIGGLGSIF